MTWSENTMARRHRHGSLGYDGTPRRSKDMSDDDAVVQTASGLGYVELVEGQGVRPAAGDSVSVHYTGWLKDGTKFDSSLDRGQPFEFAIGRGRVIRGWDEGVGSMKGGGKRQPLLPGSLGVRRARARRGDPARRHAHLRGRAARRHRERLKRRGRDGPVPRGAIYLGGAAIHVVECTHTNND